MQMTSQNRSHPHYITKIHSIYCVLSQNSFASAFQHLYALKLCRDEVTLLDAPHTGRSSCEDEVARLEQIELAGVGDDLIHGVEHIARPSHLACLAVELHLKM